MEFVMRMSDDPVSESESMDSLSEVERAMARLVGDALARKWAAESKGSSCVDNERD